MTEKRPILIAGTDNEETEGLERELREQGHETITAYSLAETGQRISENVDFALAIIDVTAMGDDIWKECERLQKKKIPFIIIAPQRSPVIQRYAVQYEASGLLARPLPIKDILEHVRIILGE